MAVPFFEGRKNSRQRAADIWDFCCSPRAFTVASAPFSTNLMELWTFHLSLMPHSVKPLLFSLLVLGGDVCRANTEVGADVFFGIEHDSNVAVDEVDRSTNLGDIGRRFGGGIRVNHDFSEDVSGKISYGFNAIDYAEFDRLSRQTHTLSTGLTRNMGSLKGNVNYFFTNSRLDNSNFLTYHRVSPSLSGFVSKRWFFRGGYVYGDKTLKQRPGRDATSHGLETDAYYFWRGLRRYFNLGYAYKTENSRADRFDFSGHTVKLRAVQRLELGANLSTLEGGLRYEQRDYQSLTPSIGENRFDDRIKVFIRLDYALTKRLTWRIYADYSDYQSNLPSADYDQTVLGTEIKFSF